MQPYKFITHNRVQTHPTNTLLLEKLSSTLVNVKKIISKCLGGDLGVGQELLGTISGG
jgi:hypothetical protein